MSYPGSKAQAGVWQRIIGQMPAHSVYVEPFLGSGKVFWEKRRADNSILVDVNPRMISAAVARLGDAAGVRCLVDNALTRLPSLFTWLPADAVVYCDPPYLLTTRTKQMLYEFEGVSDELAERDHEQLLALLTKAPCRVLLSAYPSELYSSRLHGWRCLEYDVMTRGGKRREQLWCNFPEPAELHDWRFAGFNRRHRFTMKRAVERLVERIAAKPPREAGYFFQELQNAIVRRQGRRPGSLDPLTPRLAMAATTNGHAKALDLRTDAKAIAALCVSGRSIYKHLPGVDAYDRRRDARTFPANSPAVAHPPCRLWSKFLSHQAKSPDREAEMELGRWCVRTVMRCGGVVEQPAESRLWAEMNLPMPNDPDADGCWTLYVEQKWFGCPTRKPTWLLICGVPKDQLPPLPFDLAAVQRRAKAPGRGASSFARSRTPNTFAEWLCQVARRAMPMAAAKATGRAVHDATAGV